MASPRQEKMELERMERELGYTSGNGIPTTEYRNPAPSKEQTPIHELVDGVIYEDGKGSYHVRDFDADPLALYCWLRNEHGYKPRNAFQSVLSRFCTDRDAYWQRVAKAGRADRFTWSEGDLERIDEADIEPIKEAHDD